MWLPVYDLTFSVLYNLTQTIFHPPQDHHLFLYLKLLHITLVPDDYAFYSRSFILKFLILSNLFFMRYKVSLLKELCNCSIMISEKIILPQLKLFPFCQKIGWPFNSLDNCFSYITKIILITVDTNFNIIFSKLFYNVISLIENLILCHISICILQIFGIFTIFSLSYF